jgi:[ribosomal protein S5]-alanine N-acetyltransferase
MELIPIKQKLEDNKEFVNNPLCEETLYAIIEFYKKIGFAEPWICYYAKVGHNLVGSAGFKGKPKDGKIEIAYGTFEKYQQQGVGAEMCRLLVELSLKTDPSVQITARTLPEKNYSTKILTKNFFEFAGVVNDPEDGEVWEWVYGKKH